MANKVPKGAAAEKELARIRRNEQRAKRRRRKKIEALADEANITFDQAEARLLAEERATPKPQQPTTEAANPEFITQDPENIDPDSIVMPTMETIKRDLMIAFHALGGVQGLTRWGQRNPKDFYALWGKYCLPDEDDDGVNGDSLEAIIAQLDGKGHSAH